MVDAAADVPQRRGSLVWFAIGVLPFLALVAWHWSLGPLAMFGDWSHYLLHADAIYRGRAYTDIGYLFTNLNPYIGPRAQPPGLPLVLAPILAITGGSHDLTIYKLLMVAFALAFLACAFIYIARRSGPAIAAASVTITGLWLETGFVTNVVQPDVGFCAFIWAILCIADGKRAWTTAHVGLVTVLGLAAIGFRVAAIPLVPALAVYALVHRRRLGWRPIIPVAVWAACGVAAAIAIPGALTFARILAVAPARIVDNVVQAARVYPFAALDLALFPFPWNRLNDVYHLVFMGLAVIGAIHWFRRSYTSLLATFVVFYLAMLFVLPMQDGRYLMPLAPLLVYAAWLGTSVAMRWLAPRLGRPALAERGERVAFITAAAVALLAFVTQVRQPAPPVLVEVTGVRSVFGLLQRERSSAPVRAVFVNPRVLTWETGVPAMGFFDASPDATLAEFRAHGITHVVVGDVGTDPMHAASIARAVTERPGAFRSVFAEGAFTVFRFDSTRAPAPAP